MNNCLEVADFKELGNQFVGDFDRRIAAIPDDMRGPFHDEARYLESQLLTVYQVVVTLARKSENLSQIAAWWKSMAEICDYAIARLGDLDQCHPGCGTDQYRDRLLDLRNKCSRLQQMHS
jgi:hypothetical protein